MTTNQTRRFVLKKLENRSQTNMSRWTMEEMDAIVERTITPELRGLWQAVRNADPENMSALARVNARQLLNYALEQRDQLEHDH